MTPLCPETKDKKMLFPAIYIVMVIHNIREHYLHRYMTDFPDPHRDAITCS